MLLMVGFTAKVPLVGHAANALSARASAKPAAPAAVILRKSRLSFFMKNSFLGSGRLTETVHSRMQRIDGDIRTFSDGTPPMRLIFCANRKDRAMAQNQCSAKLVDVSALGKHI
jgi:hypothetical protein